MNNTELNYNNETLHFEVAESIFSIYYEGEIPLKKLIPSYAPFHIKEIDAQKVAFRLYVSIAPQVVSLDAQEVGQFDCGGVNHGVYRCENGDYYITIGTLEGGISCVLHTTPDFSECRASLQGTEADHAFGLNNALMIAFSFSTACDNTLLIHSSVPMHRNKGILCLGKSGTGKSTHSRLWMENIPGTDLLNDDNPALRYHPESGKVIVYGTPWSGKTPCYRNMSIEVGAFIQLEQYPQNIIRRESAVKAFATILSACSTMIWDKASYQHICQTVAKIAGIAPVFHLQCLPNAAAAQTSHHAIFSDTDTTSVNA